MSRELPQWVYDVVIELLEHEEVHPKYWQQTAGDAYVRPDRCGCEPLEHVPAEFKAVAEAVALDRRRRDGAA